MAEPDNKNDAAHTQGANPAPPPRVNPKPKAAAPPKQPPAKPPAKAPSGKVRPPAGRTRFRRRHTALVLSFYLVVVMPVLLASWYLWTRAADQYASSVGFSVRREEATSPLDFLSGGVPGLSGSSSTDTDILYEFIQSQKLVAEIDAAINLKAIWSKPENDPIFAFDPNDTIEDLMIYWAKMVQIYYNRGAGLIEVRVLAFDPDDAKLIAETLLAKSSEMINSLSAIARDDSIRYSWEELTSAKERLAIARQKVQEFRNLNQLVDPSIEVAAQSQLIGALQSQLADARITLELLRETAPDSDPRTSQAKRRIFVIEAQIEEQRQKMGIGSAGNDDGRAFADIIGEYERLIVEREFAEKTYISALASYDLSLADARQKSRYLAAFTQPTRAESSRFPKRATMLGLLGLLLFLAWSIVSLVAYSLKDRR